MRMSQLPMPTTELVTSQLLSDPYRETCKQVHDEYGYVAVISCGTVLITTSTAIAVRSNLAAKPKLRAYTLRLTSRTSVVGYSMCRFVA